MIIVGSHALQQRFPDYREPSDIDFWFGENEEIPNDLKGDIVVVPDEIMIILGNKRKYCNINDLYTIKCSHLGWDNHAWEKHKKDIIFLKSKGCSLNRPLFDKLIEFWKKKLGNKEFLSLDKSKEQFFTDNVTYIYDHDYLHELVAYPNKPVYESCLEEDKEVKISKEKFDLLDFSDKVRMFREEISVIAYERWVVNPYWKGSISWYQAYSLALRKTITNLTKNWATEFIILNLEYFVKPKFEYFKHLLETLEKKDMSKVDLTIFENLLKEGGAKNSLPRAVYYLCEDDFAEGVIHYDGDYNNYQKRVSDLSDKYGYEHLQQEGGGEGGSEGCYGVFKLGGKIYRAEYSYYSHYGCDYDDILSTLKEVEPVEKTITVYE